MMIIVVVVVVPKWSLFTVTRDDVFSALRPKLNFSLFVPEFSQCKRVLTLLR